MCCGVQKKGMRCFDLRCRTKLCTVGRHNWIVLLGLSVLTSRFPNSSQFIYRWSSDLDRKLRKSCGNSLGITINRWDGQFLTSFMREPEPGEFPLDPEAGSRSDRPLYDINRADLHIGCAPVLNIVDCRMFEYAQEIGVDCHLGTFVDEYFEEEDRAGIILKGQRLEADLLIAAVNRILPLCS